LEIINHKYRSIAYTKKIAASIMSGYFTKYFDETFRNNGFLKPKSNKSPNKKIASSWHLNPDKPQIFVLWKKQFSWAKNAGQNIFFY
jgi:hypothetical protein